MSIETPAAKPDDAGPQLAQQFVYLKDCSFEAPKGPRVDGAWNPQISLDLNTQAESLSPELRAPHIVLSAGTIMSRPGARDAAGT